MTLPTRYQKVNTTTDYALVDDNGVPFPVFIFFDGIDDALQTNNIDFTATDKMTVFAGVRKLSDAATGLLTEFSASTATNAGSFFVALPIAPTSSYRFESKGTVISNASSLFAAYPAPITNILTGIGNISGDLAILRVNGAQAASSTTDQGTGNYGNYPLYIGARAGTSAFFNGNLYNLIVRGAQSTAAQIESTEKWVNGKTAAF